MSGSYTSPESSGSDDAQPAALWEKKDHQIIRAKLETSFETHTPPPEVERVLKICTQIEAHH